jgi:hypothetical protein
MNTANPLNPCPNSPIFNALYQEGFLVFRDRYIECFNSQVAEDAKEDCREIFNNNFVKSTQTKLLEGRYICKESHDVLRGLLSTYLLVYLEPDIKMQLQILGKLTTGRDLFLELLAESMFPEHGLPSDDRPQSWELEAYLILVNTFLSYQFTMHAKPWFIDLMKSTIHALHDLSPASREQLDLTHIEAAIMPLIDENHPDNIFSLPNRMIAAKLALLLKGPKLKEVMGSIEGIIKGSISRNCLQYYIRDRYLEACQEYKIKPGEGIAEAKDSLDRLVDEVGQLCS